jgi:hypothetical protein
VVICVRQLAVPLVVQNAGASVPLSKFSVKKGVKIGSTVSWTVRDCAKPLVVSVKTIVAVYAPGGSVAAAALRVAATFAVAPGATEPDASERLIHA